MGRQMEYERTHQWLSFELDLRKLDFRTWALLGGARADICQISRVALRPRTAERLHKIYMAKGVLATTAIEGNTLTEEEAQKVLANELQLPPSKEYLARELQNIAEACTQIGEQALTEKLGPLTAKRVMLYNFQVRDGLEEEEGTAPAGELRDYSVTVGRYRGAPAEDCEYLLDRLCGWLEELEAAAEKKTPHMKMEFAILRAVMAHLYIAWIHPFGEGNGRTARLVEFDILLRAGVPTPAAHLLSNHYNETRSEYYRQLDGASRSGGDVSRLLQYAAQGLSDQLKDQLRFVRTEQLDIAWRNFVYENFRDRRTVAEARRRQLVLDLSGRRGAVPFGRLREVSSRVGVSYSTKTSKTLRRDINVLLERELVVELEDGFRANKARLLAFMPMGVNDFDTAWKLLVEPAA